MSKGSTIQIRVGAVEVTIDGSIEREQLADVLGTVRNQLAEFLDPDLEAPRAPTAAALLAESEAKTFGEKAGVIAYWLERHRGRADWRSGDIVDALREAGEPVPANITDALNQKLKKGLFEVHDRRWKLTGEGRGWVKWRLLHERDDDE